MARPRQTLKQHLNSQQLKQRYLKCRQGIEKRHWHALWLLSREEKDLSAQEVSGMVGCTPDWIRKLMRRYNAKGIEGVGDTRKANHRPRILDHKGMDRLREVLKQKPTDGGLWTGAKVARWIGFQTGKSLSSVGGWKYLKRLGWSLKVPRPSHIQSATPAQQRALKKTRRTNSTTSRAKASSQG
jgi:transposase